VEELANFLVNEIQEVYRLQGVLINDKHIEVIVRQMLQKVEITDAGETDLINGDQMDKIELDELNAKMKEEGKKPAKGHPVLLGITKAEPADPLVHRHARASFQETTARALPMRLSMASTTRSEGPQGERHCRPADTLPPAPRPPAR
jgi:DNA-directed RNA polymerase subunit beta'